ncbi:MAG: hypothetical protein Q9161_006612 [Pseudevernia consocians]
MPVSSRTVSPRPAALYSWRQSKLHSLARSRIGTFAFFDGRLKGNVIAVWATEKEILEKECDGQKPEQDFIGLCQLLESDENEGEQRCKIRLSFDKIFDGPDPRSQMWETMFHELVHAYALISSDHNVFIDYRALGDPYHDNRFDCLLSTVERRSAIICGYLPSLQAMATKSV